MPIVTGQITEHGAVIDVLIGVSLNRENVLRRNGLPVPTTVPVRLLIDTGSSLTGVLADVFRTLEVKPHSTIPLRTPSTKPGEPHVADQYDVSLYLVSGIDAKRIPSIQIIGVEDFDREADGVQGILGTDILGRCAFLWYGPQGEFQLGYD